MRAYLPHLQEVVNADAEDTTKKQAGITLTSSISAVFSNKLELIQWDK